MCKKRKNKLENKKYNKQEKVSGKEIIIYK